MTTNSEWSEPRLDDGADQSPNYPDYGGRMTPDADVDQGYAGSWGRHSQPGIDADDLSALPETDLPAGAEWDGPAEFDDAGVAYVYEAESVGESISSAAFGAFVRQMDDRLGAVHEVLNGTVTSLEENLERSLAALRDREEMARHEVSRDLLRPLAQRFAMLFDRIELAIARREEDPCDPWLLSQTAVDEALEILEEFGVVDIAAEPGAEVDRARHRVVKMVNEKSDSTDSSRILERRRHGLEVDGYVVRAAEVVAEWVPGSAEGVPVSD